MVARLGKPGEAILKSLSPWDCYLTHMGGCLPGEAAELYDALDQKSVDILEELGDYAFYLVACRSAFNHYEWSGMSGGIAATKNNAVRLMLLGGHFWDVVKRITIYRKPMDQPDSKYEGRTLRAVALELLEQMEQSFNAILTHHNYSLEDVLEANYDKLANADTGRYSKGTYSDAQAQDRQDKKGDNKPK